MANANAINRSINKNQTGMKRINTLAQVETRKVLSIANELDFDTQAGLVRKTIPTIVKKYGNVSATLGTQHYNEMRVLQTGLAAGFVATVPKLDYTDRLSKTMGYSIANGYQYGTNAMIDTLMNEITTYISDYNRDTITFNGGNEKTVVSVQRIAEQNACAFCLTVALNQYQYTVDGSLGGSVESYASDYHSNCQCSVVQVYEGQDAIYPPYYDDLQKIYEEGKQGNTEAKDVFAAIRENTGRS